MKLPNPNFLPMFSLPKRMNHGSDAVNVTTPSKINRNEYGEIPAQHGSSTWLERLIAFIPKTVGTQNNTQAQEQPEVENPNFSLTAKTKDQATMTKKSNFDNVAKLRRYKKK